MREIKDIFKPEGSPIHKREFSVATQLVLEEGDKAKEVIPAGTLLKSKTSGKRIELMPEAGCQVATVADVAEALGVLMHDVVVEKDVDKYSVGVLIKGVVYADAMTEANTSANFTDEVITAIAPNITTYNVITLKK